MMVSWLTSTLLGLNVAGFFTGFDPASVRFAGPLVMMAMMMLFIKGSKARSTPWVVSGVSALALHEFGAANYLKLLIAVATGAAVDVVLERMDGD